MYDKIIQVENFEKSKSISVPIDLSPSLVNGVGQICVVVLPSQEAYYPNNWSRRPIVKAWIQVTCPGALPINIIRSQTWLLKPLVDLIESWLGSLI